jgi:hypothetical protein
MEWLDRLAQTFELDAPTNQEIVAVLDAARDVAHRVERKLTPVSTFLLGMNVERQVSAGASRQEALTSAVAALEATLPPGSAEEGSGDAG